MEYRERKAASRKERLGRAESCKVLLSREFYYKDKSKCSEVLRERSTVSFLFQVILSDVEDVNKSRSQNTRQIHEAIQCFKPHSAPQCACLKHSILICASEIKPIIHKTVCKSQRTNIYIFVCISIIASVAFYLNIAVYILNPTQGFPTLRPSIPTPSSLPLPSLLFFLFSAPPLHPFPPTPPTIY